MIFETGLAVIEATETETKCFHIDQDALEFARLNAQTKKRLKDAEKARKKAAYHSNRAAKADAERKVYTLKTVRAVLANCAICGAVTWAGMAGMVHPAISLTVSVFFLCAACVRLGAWYGKVVKNNNEHSR